jgi:hypothetical protein
MWQMPERAILLETLPASRLAQTQESLPSCGQEQLEAARFD